VRDAKSDGAVGRTYKSILVLRLTTTELVSGPVALAVVVALAAIGDSEIRPACQMKMLHLLILKTDEVEVMVDSGKDGPRTGSPRVIGQHSLSSSLRKSKFHFELNIQTTHSINHITLVVEAKYRTGND